MPNGRGVEWAECSLIIGTGCRVPVFSFKFVRGYSVCWRFGSRDPLGSIPAFSRDRQLVPFRFEHHLPVPENRN